MSNVLTQNWKENGKAVKGLREGFFVKDLYFRESCQNPCT